MKNTTLRLPMLFFGQYFTWTLVIGKAFAQSAERIYQGQTVTPESELVFPYHLQLSDDGRHIFCGAILVHSQQVE